MDGGRRDGPRCPGHAAVISALVRLLDSKGNSLHAIGREMLLQFVPSSRPVAGEGQRRDTWVLRAVAGRGGAVSAVQYTLQHASSRKYLSAACDKLGLDDKPQELQVYMDMGRRVALCLAGKACLQVGPGGVAVVGRLPLGRHRGSKLFMLEEAGVPPHSLLAWPLRAVLRCEHIGGGYLSACSGGTLSTTAPAACCTEEFLLAPGQGGQLRAQGNTLLVAPGCTIWSGDGRQLLSHDRCTGRLLLRGQHSVAGRELFTLHFSSSGGLSLLAEQPAEPAAEPQPSPQDPQGACNPSLRSSPPVGSGGVGAAYNRSTSGTLAPVVVRYDGLFIGGSGGSGKGGGKASRLGLELASQKPTLLLTAHGQLLGCRGSESRPSGTLLPAPQRPLAAGDPMSPRRTTSVTGSTSSSVTGPGSRAACLAGATWLLEHHGDSVYSLKHGASGRSLYVDDSGSPCLDAQGGTIVYPNERLLFWIEPSWVTLEAPAPITAASPPCSAPAASTADAACAAMPAEQGATGYGSSGNGNWENTGACTAAGFVQPCADSSDSKDSSTGSLTVAGFSIRSVHRVGGRHLYLSALPDGLLTTVHALDRPSRWELFSVIDYQTLLHSPLNLLDRLPCAPQQPAAHSAQHQPEAQHQRSAQPALRRTVSMQALCSGSSTRGGCSGSRDSHQALDGRPLDRRGSLTRAPSLTTVHEHRPDSLAGNPEVQQAPGEQPQAPEDKPLQPPRRCHSETALAGMQQEAGDRRPLWLAQVRRQPRRPEGWGTCSAASLQDIACRQLSVTLVQQHQEQHNGKDLPPGLPEAVEAELSGHLPEELVSGIGRELRLLAKTPAPTKLSLMQLTKAAALAGSTAEAAAKQLLPTWAIPFVGDPSVNPNGGGGGGDVAAAMRALLQWQPIEAYLCCGCHGASGALLPLDPYVNPSHHLFLRAMERRARGGGRVRLRAPRRLDREDPWLRALKTGKVALLSWAICKSLVAIFSGSSGRRH